MENVKVDGVALEKTTRRLLLDNGCSIMLLNHTEKGGKTLHKKKWGDFLFGLFMGKIWNGWEFLRVSVKTADGIVWPVSSFPPSEFYLTSIEAANFAEIKWPLSADGNGFLRLLIFQFPSHRNWLFFKIETNEGVGIESLALSCYPSTSHWADAVPERERIAATKENVYNVSAGKHEFTPQTPGMVLFNKYIHTDDGCMIVMDHEAVQAIKLSKTTNDIAPGISFKPGVRSFTFAFGYFKDSPAEKEAAMFLGETQDSIYSFLKGIEWSPSMDAGKVEKQVADLERIFAEAAKMGLAVPDDARRESEAWRAKALEAVRRRDIAAFGESLGKFEELRKRVVEQLLNNFK